MSQPSKYKECWIRCCKYYLKKYHIFSPFIILMCFLYTYYLSVKLCRSFRRNIFVYTNGIFPVEVERFPSSVVVMNDYSFIELGRFGNIKSTRLRLLDCATFVINGQLSIGEDVFIDIRSDSILEMGGESVTGITCASKIICVDSIKIGAGVIISWGCTITDSSHHSINGVLKTLPIVIADNVWINMDCILTAGACVSEGIIVAAKSFVNSDIKCKNSLIGGAPARILKKHIVWR